MCAAKARNATTTRAAILEAARCRFVIDAYDRVGLRDIAADAGVDAALVCRYFGPKAALFAEVVATTSGDPMAAVRGDRATFGTRLAAALSDSEQRSHEQSMAFIKLAVRSMASPEARELVRRCIEERFVGPLADWLGGSNASERAWTIASILMGAAVMNQITDGRALKPGPTDAAADRLADVLQAVAEDR